MTDSSRSRPDSSAPTVAIVGRPNVGKSTLFNRLVGSRRAITDPTPGVTRDTVEALCRLGGRLVRLVDTGGYQTEVGEIDALVAKRSLEAIDSADLVMLVLDVIDVTPEDEELAVIVRTRAKRSMLVVNKVDHDSREADAWNLHALGFDPVVHVSAEHKRNFQAIDQAVASMLESVTTVYRAPGEREEVRIALLGKPNTGKSTLLNRLLGEDRSIVSPIPGTTRDVIEGRFTHKSREFVLLDTAGIRRKRAVHESVEYYSVSRAIASIDRSDVVVLVVDSTEGIADQDKKIATQAVKRGRGIIIALSKWDLAPDIPNTFQAVSDRTRFVFPVVSWAPVVAVSALTGQGIDELLDTAVTVWKELRIRIATGPLNRGLQSWVMQHPVPHGGGPYYSVKYMTQTSANPLKFLLFVNRAKGFPESWLSFAQNRLREEFSLRHVPLSIELRES
jgi:GTPase